jgi:hypothetical protein
MKILTMREFRATVARVDEPVKVGNGIWFPESTPVLEAIGDGVAVLGVGIDLAVAERSDEKFVFVVQKEQTDGPT